MGSCTRSCFVISKAFRFIEVYNNHDIIVVFLSHFQEDLMPHLQDSCTIFEPVAEKELVYTFRENAEFKVFKC